MAGNMRRVVVIRDDNPLNDLINLNTLVTLSTLNILAIWGAIVNALLEDKYN